MEIEIIFKFASVGMIIAILNQVLVRAGRDDQAMMTSLIGLIVVLYWLIEYIDVLFKTINTTFMF